MSDEPFEQPGDAPTMVVRVFRNGELVSEELCESEEDALVVVESWQEQEGVRCEVDDLTVRHRPGDILEPEPALLDDEAHDPVATAPETGPG